MLPKEWLYSIPINDDIYILYAPLHRRAVKISAQASQEMISILNDDRPYSDFQSGVLDFLKSNGLTARPSFKSNEKKKDSHKIYLSITNKCNLRCIYCYAITGIDSHTMLFRNAKNAIDYQLKQIVKSNGDSISVTFHGGGEALVELNLMKEIVAYIYRLSKEYRLKLKLGCVTNATLITEEVAKWLAKYFSKLTVSLDGSQDIQDIQRPSLGGSGSYNNAMRGIKNLINEQISFSIRSTVTGFSTNHMGEFVSFLKESIFMNGGNVDFEPVSLCGRAKHNDTLVVNPVLFFENYILARRIGKQIGVNVSCAMDTFGLTREVYCGASKASLKCYTPEGMISACTRVTKEADDGFALFLYGKIKDDKIIICSDKKQDIINYGNIYKDKCISCFARWNCQGGCPFTRHSNQDHFEQVCFLTKELLLYDLENILESHSSEND
jgi:uncharacterized protein